MNFLKHTDRTLRQNDAYNTDDIINFIFVLQDEWDFVQRSRPEQKQNGGQAWFVEL